MRWISALLIASTACSSPHRPVSSAPTHPIDSQALGISTLLTTINQGTARINIAAALGTSPAAIKATGVLNMKTGTGVFTFTAGGIPSGDFEVRFIKGVAFMRLPKPYSLIPGTKPWIKLDIHVLARAGYFGKVGSVGAQNPADSLAFLRGAKDAQVIGSETIGDATTTHYKIGIDLERAQAAVPKGETNQLLYALIESGVTNHVVDLWVDAQNRTRRVTYTIDLAKIGGGSVGATPDLVTMTVEYSDFGVPVNVEAPPPDQVGDYSAALSRGKP